VTATTTTTIQGVSVLTTEKKRRPDVFDLLLSPTGIEVRRPGRPVQQMTWDRVSEWEIEEHKGYVLLTLRGRGATTPLRVPGWSLDELEVLMRTITSDGAYEAADHGPVVVDDHRNATNGNGTAAMATAAATASVEAPAVTLAPTPTRPSAAPARPRKQAAPRTERRQRAARERRRVQAPWKLAVTVVLLVALGTAVTLVLLQSAGVINWSILGPVA
jgi:hypothetical protein